MMYNKRRQRNQAQLFLAIISTHFVVSAGLDDIVRVGCVVDYRGTIRFNLKLPTGCTDWKELQPSFFYKTKETAWKQEKDCGFVYKNNNNNSNNTNNNNTNNNNNNNSLNVEESSDYQCAMHQLTKRYKSFDIYDFKLTVINNGSIKTITSLYHSSKRHLALHPWQYFVQLAFCADVYGIKYMTVHATESKIVAEWLLFPMDASSPEDTYILTITIEDNKGVIKKHQIWKADEGTCDADICKFSFRGLHACVDYKICLEADNNFGTLERNMKCRHVRTDCRRRSIVKSSPSNVPIWQNVLLVTFGCIVGVTMTFLTYSGYSVFHRHRRRFHSSRDNEYDIVSEEDLINFRVPSD